MPMTVSFAVLLVACVLAALGLAYVLLEFVIGPRARAQEEARLARLIRPLGVEHYRFTGLDDQLRVNADRRRREVEVKRLEAAQIASGKPIDSRIRMVGRR